MYFPCGAQYLETGNLKVFSDSYSIQEFTADVFLQLTSKHRREYLII